MLHEIDLIETKLGTGRGHGNEDMLHLEGRVQREFSPRLALCAPAEAAALFARYADHITCAAALTNSHAEVRALALETLREFAAEGNPFAREILAQQYVP